MAAFEILDTCYNFTGYSRIRVPAVALQFSAGVTFNVDASGILLFASPSQGCLAFASVDEDGLSMVGNMQQRTFDVVYDVAREMIGCLLGRDPSGVSAQTLAASSGNKLTVVHRHGPCSPIINTRQKLNHRQILHRDQARVISLHNRITAASRKDKSTGVTVPNRVGLSFSTSDYIVTVGFGTPKKSFSVIFDTGSDISWIQCRPCAGGCYSQNETLFDPSQSSTCANISCSSAVCLSFGSDCDASSTCIYAVQYSDGSSTAGFLAQETLTLTSSIVLKNFEFGCGEKNKRPLR
ncbi:protein ASPARTIC PROTEASE IN GUARD CELL 1-like [Phoenix dactylifera]|uniref:Protein ASPARTIC PROTEASE IN GUARD CELL 1-like n=1 Tax=Phoenix dactylifera TaxID=42345 RepID=A0A8B8ZQ73_PHODC|nr:protein ASPARTIC PROTEASE IN GUARD CELL 1-like [Phoenix dactylifera]